MMKFYRVFFAFAVVILLTAAAVPVMAQQRLVENIDKKTSFSIVIPEGFMTIKSPGLKYKALVGPTEDYTPTIAFVLTPVPKNEREQFNEKINDGIAAARQANPQLEIISKEEFVTLSGLRGIKVVSRFALPDGRLADSNSFYFQSNNKANLMTIQAMIITEFRDKYVEIFNNALKSFEWTN